MCACVPQQGLNMLVCSSRCECVCVCASVSHLDGGVVLVYEVVLDELYGQGALAHPSGPDHHQLVLGHGCSCRVTGRMGERFLLDHFISFHFHTGAVCACACVCVCVCVCVCAIVGATTRLYVHPLFRERVALQRFKSVNCCFLSFIIIIKCHYKYKYAIPLTCMWLVIFSPEKFD